MNPTETETMVDLGQIPLGHAQALLDALRVALHFDDIHTENRYRQWSSLKAMLQHQIAVAQ